MGTRGGDQGTIGDTWGQIGTPGDTWGHVGTRGNMICNIETNWQMLKHAGTLDLQTYTNGHLETEGTCGITRTRVYMWTHGDN